MAKKNQSISKTLNDIANIDRALPPNADIFEQLDEQTSDVIRASLSNWQAAYEIAKDIDNPRREDLHEIFETIEIDTHVSAVTETVFHGIASMDFSVKDVNGEKDEEITRLFKTTWFNDWLAIVVEAIFWGVSGVQYGTIEDDKFTTIKSIPRFNIRPKQRGVVFNQNRDRIDISFEDEPYKTWTSLIFPRMFGDQYQLGKYNKIAKWFILKREVTQFWAIYNELFGHPLRVTKTNIKDAVRRKNAATAMEKMTTASFAIIDLDDEIEFVVPSTGQGYTTFKDFIEIADKQMSKSIIGSTMVLDEGSSRSQGEVHLQNTNAFILGYASFVQNFINDELIPKMSKLGIKISTENRFEYEHIERLTKSQWVDIIDKLSNKFDIPTDVITELTGIAVEEKEVQLPVTTDDKTIENKSLVDLVKGIQLDTAVNNFYKKYIKR